MEEPWENLRKNLQERSRKHKWWHGFDIEGWCLQYMYFLDQLSEETVEEMCGRYKRRSFMEKWWSGNKVFSDVIDIAKKHLERKK